MPGSSFAIASVDVPLPHPISSTSGARRPNHASVSSGSLVVRTAHFRHAQFWPQPLPGIPLGAGQRRTPRAKGGGRETTPFRLGFIQMYNAVQVRTAGLMGVGPRPSVRLHSSIVAHERPMLPLQVQIDTQQLLSAGIGYAVARASTASVSPFWVVRSAVRARRSGQSDRAGRT